MNKKSILCILSIVAFTVLTANAAITNIQTPPSSVKVAQGETFNLVWEMDLNVSDALVSVNIPSLSSELSYTKNSFTATVNGYDNSSSFVDNSSATSIAISTSPGNATLPDLSTGHLIITIPVLATGAIESYSISWRLTTGDTETWPFETEGTTAVNPIPVPEYNTIGLLLLVGILTIALISRIRRDKS